MTSAFVEYMEENAYNSAVRDFCIPKRDSEKIAMHELFDFIAGSETGSIIGSTLVIKNNDTSTVATQENMYFADTATKWFLDNDNALYHNPKLSFWWGAPIALVLALLVSWASYSTLETIYTDVEFNDHNADLALLLKIEKKIAKGKKVELDDFENKMKYITNEFKNVNVQKYPETSGLFRKIKDE